MKQKVIVVITNKRDTDSDLIIERLNDKSENVIRFNTEDFPKSIDFVFDPFKSKMVFYLPYNRVINVGEVKSILYRKPNPHEIDLKIKNKAFKIFAQRESCAVMKGFYECFNGLWINHPLKIRAASQKIHQLQVAKKLGFQIPETLITNKITDAKTFYHKYEKDGIIIKPISFPMVESEDGFYTFSTTLVKEKHLSNLDFVRYAPTLFQRKISKKYELRVTVVGDEVFVCEIYSQISEKTKLDWRFFDQDNPIPHKIGKLPSGLEKKCINLVKTLSLSYGAIDIILTPDNHYIFLEINPSGMWGWIEYLTNLPISESIANLLIKGKEKSPSL